MFKRAILSVSAAIPMLFAAAPAIHADDVHCSYEMGFATIAQAMPFTVGGCLSHAIGLGNGDVAQLTTRGTMTWYQNTNVATFNRPDLNTTWVLTGSALQMRGSDDRFSFEGPSSQVAGVSIVAHEPSPARACLAAAILAAGADRPANLTVTIPPGNVDC